jgi:CspA family cold shock protein
MRGQVKWFDPKKGYGFIVGPEGQDVFVHYSHIDAEGFKALRNGEWVDYELVQGDKGWQARAVKGTGVVTELPASASAPATRSAPVARRPSSAPSYAPARRATSGYQQSASSTPPIASGYQGADDVMKPNA